MNYSVPTVQLIEKKDVIGSWKCKVLYKEVHVGGGGRTVPFLKKKKNLFLSLFKKI